MCVCWVGGEWMMCVLGGGVWVCLTGGGECEGLCVCVGWRYVCQDGYGFRQS